MKIAVAVDFKQVVVFAIRNAVARRSRGLRRIAFDILKLGHPIRAESCVGIC